VTRPRASWGWDAVRVTLDGITHDGRLWSNGAVDAKCDISCGRGTVHETGVLAAGVPEIDCMSCLVKQARREASSE